MYNDSIHKILGYIEACQNNHLIISPGFYRDYTCPPHCGGCCPKFSLDYFEGPRWNLFKELYPEKVGDFVEREVNGVKVFSNLQKQNKSPKCMYLYHPTGRCTVHKANPFTCEFELNKFMVRGDKTYLINRLFGRGWNMSRTDGGRGARCEMLPFNYDKFRRDVELLNELYWIAVRMGKEVPLLADAINFLKPLKEPVNKPTIFSR